MTRHPSPSFLLPLLLFCLPLLPACLGRQATDLTYALQPVSDRPLAGDPTAFPHLIQIMPVRLPPHLQQRGILLQQAANQNRISPTHLWAGTLADQIGATVAANLAILLGTDNVTLYPGPRYGVIGHQVEIEISEFSGSSETFTINAHLTISDSLAKVIRARKSLQRTLTIDKPGYSGYVTTASQAAALLSRELAEILLEIRKAP